MKSKKRLRRCYGSFLSNLVGRGHSFYNFFKGGLKKSFGNPALE